MKVDSDLCHDAAASIIRQLDLDGACWRWDHEWLFLQGDDQEETHRRLTQVVDDFVEKLVIDEVRRHLHCTRYDVFKAAFLVDDPSFIEFGWTWENFLRDCLISTIYAAVRDLLRPSVS